MSRRLPLFEVEPDQIARVVRVFYAAVRRHPVLGPVFAGHISDWPEHEEKIIRFWRNAILREGGYDGNPMRVHDAAGDVLPDHFPLWLALFDETLNKLLSEELAARWSALAHRIGRGLRMGVERSAPGAPPVLR